ncbi:MAG: class C sortase [Ruminococcus sp.]|nr:class C sortase [Ruminococcus sp.]
MGLSVMLYPTVSDWWNSKTQSRAIAEYVEQVEKLDEVDYEAILELANEYNEQIKQLSSPFTDYDEVEGYEDILDVAGNGVMGYISIPQINVELPIYHGTSEGVLNVAVGHLQGSTLPVGGEGTHAVISAHRGLPSAKLFSDLDDLVVGDTFTITVLKEVYTYEVEEINIVEPDQMDKLLCVDGEDLVTLMTCTPYGVNTHRLLVRAHRIDTIYDKETKTASVDAIQLDSLLVVPFIAAPLLILLIIYWVWGGRKDKKKKSVDKLASDFMSADEKANPPDKQDEDHDTKT